MIGRAILAALLAGIAAGLIMGAIQHVRLTPLIVAAEAFEQAELPGAANSGHEHNATAWMPAEGWQRTLSTTLSSTITGAGFAGLLAGISLLTGLAINRRNGMLWGLCGFLAVTLAPAAGLPPELPGMPGADLAARQVWWVGTILATSAGIWLLARRREAWAMAVAAIVIALPHVLGAPVAAGAESRIPAELAASFVANSLAANAVFWALIGAFLGMAFDVTAKEIYKT